MLKNYFFAGILKFSDEIEGSGSRIRIRIRFRIRIRIHPKMSWIRNTGLQIPITLMRSKIRIRIEVKSWFRIRIKVKSWIRVRLKVKKLVRIKVTRILVYSHMHNYGNCHMCHVTPWRSADEAVELSAEWGRRRRRGHASGGGDLSQDAFQFLRPAHSGRIFSFQLIGTGTRYRNIFLGR